MAPDNISRELAAFDGTDRQRLMNSTWTHHMPTPFSQGWRVGNLVFTGGQLSADQHGNVLGVGDIETQTRNVFESLTSVLAEAGATWEDVVKLNTYYCFDGDGEDVKRNWEIMTRVRMEYIPDEGPAGTGVRVAGLMYDGFLIEVEAIAVIRNRSSARDFAPQPNQHQTQAKPRQGETR